MTHRIILVREWDSQASGSGCCGRLGGASHELCGADTYAMNRREMEAMGRVYRRLREALPRDQAEITVVDPRNMVWLIPAVLRDARRRGARLGEIWREVRRGVAYNAVIVDGRTLFSGHIPEPEAALEAVRAALAGGRFAA